MKIPTIATKTSTLKWAWLWTIAVATLSAVLLTTTSSVTIPAAPPHETVPPGFSYYYASSAQHATAAGAYGTYLVEDPTTPVVGGSAGTHSLAELAVESSDATQIVEIGWSVAPLQFNDNAPHLFVYHWVNGASTCYDACGFVSTSSSITPGMTLATGTSAIFQVVYANSNWNLYYNGTRFGYFPGSLWSGAFTSVGFTQWFGEVALPATTAAPCAQMGNGEFAGTPGADTISDMGFIDGPPVSVIPMATNPTYYSIAVTAPNAMSFGGPGGCAPAPLATSTVTISSTSPANPTATQPVTLNVSVAGTSTTTPTGLVTVTDAGSTCTALLSGTNGVATGSCQITEPVAGTYTFNAFYGGDSSFSGASTTTATTVIVANPLTQPPRPGPVTIHFAPHSSALNVSASRALHTLVKKLAYGASVTLVAYAPSIGLAQIRAASVIHYFTRTILIHVVVRPHASSTKNQVTIIITGQ